MKWDARKARLHTGFLQSNDWLSNWIITNRSLSSFLFFSVRCNLQTRSTSTRSLFFHLLCHFYISFRLWCMSSDETSQYYRGCRSPSEIGNANEYSGETWRGSHNYASRRRQDNNAIVTTGNGCFSSYVIVKACQCQTPRFDVCWYALCVCVCVCVCGGGGGYKVACFASCRRKLIS
jgi:hypothetical protein